MVGYGLAPFHFSSKEFEILDLDPPINATSHYGACHFRYNLALTKFTMNLSFLDVGFSESNRLEVKYNNDPNL